jgi:ABC-type metal ion transport system substrate-binding protein
MKKLFVVILALVLALISFSVQAKEQIIIGTVVGIQESLVNEFIVPALNKLGYDVEVRVYTSFGLNINTDTVQGKTDVNFFQHEPYLKTDTANLPKLSIVWPVASFKMGLYGANASEKDVTGGGRVGIPNDKSNLQRALKLLAKEGFITLKSTFNADVNADNFTTFIENGTLKVSEIIALDQPGLKAGFRTRYSAVVLSVAVAYDTDPAKSLFKLVIGREDSSVTDGFVNVFVARAFDEKGTDAYSKKIQDLKSALKALTSDPAFLKILADRYLSVVYVPGVK